MALGLGTAGLWGQMVGAQEASWTVAELEEIEASRTVESAPLEEIFFEESDPHALAIAAAAISALAIYKGMEKADQYEQLLSLWRHTDDLKRLLQLRQRAATKQTLEDLEALEKRMGSAFKMSYAELREQIVSRESEFRRAYQKLSTQLPKDLVMDLQQRRLRARRLSKGGGVGLGLALLWAGWEWYDAPSEPSEINE